MVPKFLLVVLALTALASVSAVSVERNWQTQKLNSQLEDGLNKLLEMRSETGKKSYVETETGKKSYVETDAAKKSYIATDADKKSYVETDKKSYVETDKKSYIDTDASKKSYVETDKKSYIDTDASKKSYIDTNTNKKSYLSTQSSSKSYDLFSAMDSIIESYSTYTICEDDCTTSLSALSNFKTSVSSMIDSVDDLMADQSLIVLNMLQPVYDSYLDLQDQLEIEAESTQKSYQDNSQQSFAEKKSYTEIIGELENVGELVEELLDALVMYNEGSTNSNLLETEAGLETTKKFFKSKIEKVVPKLLELNQSSKVPLMVNTINLMKGLISIEWDSDSDALIELLSMVESNLSDVINDYQLLESELSEKYSTMEAILKKSLTQIKGDLSTLDSNLSLTSNEIEMYESSIESCEEFAQMMSKSMNSISDLGEFLESSMFSIQDKVTQQLTSSQDSLSALTTDTDMNQYVYDILY